MVDASGKESTLRMARASGLVMMDPATLALISDHRLVKGDVLEVARLAGIMAAKRTADLIPLCHQLPLSVVEVNAQAVAGAVEITASAETVAQTGVEMEALLAASVAALTLYDMAKAIDKGMVIAEVRLLEKTKEVVP